MAIKEAVSDRERFLIGGAGALAPSILTLFTADLANVFSNLTWFTFLGYAVRVAAYFLLGGFWTSFLHRSERNRAKLFQFGIVAPALLATAVNGAAVSKPIVLQLAPTTYEAASGDSCAQAGGAAQTFPELRETPAQQITRGLTGTQPKRTLFVVASFHKTLEDAKQQAQKIAHAGLTAEVYCSPGKWRPAFPFAIVIGANLALGDAERVRDRAIAAGIASAVLIDPSTK